MNSDKKNRVSLDLDGRVLVIGTDNARPVFHYSAGSDGNMKVITSYQITVHRNPDFLVWDSGKVSAEAMPYITYSGEDLKAGTRYSARIRLWNEQDQVTDFSPECVFETGFLRENWQAEWIEPVQEAAVEEESLTFMEMFAPRADFRGGESRLRECLNLRRTFDNDRTIQKARIYASSHGVYQLWMNGKKISDRRLAPEISVYKDILYYQTYDVTGMINPGTNVLGVTLADGWWIGRLGLAGDSCNFGNRLAFIMQLELDYEDGSKEVICSDEQFKSHSSFIRYSDLSIGEKHDLTMEEAGWNTADFPDQGWAACQVIAAPKAGLAGQYLDPLTVTQELEPKDIFYTPNQDLVIDFGQVLAGVGHFEIEASEGTVASFEHSEVLDADGNYKNNILGRNKDQKDVLVCRDGIQIFEPQFTYHGFRYIKVTGVKREQIIHAKALVIGTPLRKTGYFRCSDEDLNQLQHNIEWSTKSNMFSIPTDCPQREKLGWTGDIQVFSKTGCFNYDLNNFLKSWLNNLRADQAESGEVPVVVPNLPHQDRLQRGMGGDNSSAAWSDACVLVPYYHYLCYGDRTILEENFAAMKKWLGYVKLSAARKPEGYDHFTSEQKARNSYLWTKCFHFGDWLIPSLRALPDGVTRGTRETAAVVGACFYAVTVNYFIEVCKVLHETSLAQEYAELLAHIRTAVRDEYVAEDGTVNNSNLQGLYVMMLKSGSVDGELKQKVLDRLVALIKANDCCLDTGFASVPYLLDSLYDNGYEELAYRILFQTKAPSWLYMVKNGATSIWENWLAVREDGTRTDSSYNHYAFGCVGDWIYRHIGGIQSAAPGYKKIIFRPDFNCGLLDSSCEVISPFGKVALSWKKVGNDYYVSGEVPVGTTAVLNAGARQFELIPGKFETQLTI